MSSKRYCLQKERSWGICNLFGSNDTSVAWQKDFSEVSGRGRKAPFSSKSPGTAQSQSQPLPRHFIHCAIIFTIYFLQLALSICKGIARQALIFWRKGHLFLLHSSTLFSLSSCILSYLPGRIFTLWSFSLRFFLYWTTEYNTWNFVLWMSLKIR